MLWRGQTVFDAEVGAELVERVLACCGAFAQAEWAGGEFAAVIRENGADAMAAKGFVQPSDVEPLIGALLTVGSVVWSVADKRGR